MRINDIQFNVDLEDILNELKFQLSANGIELFQKQINGPTHIQVCCPYHAGGHERRPSAGIRKEDGIFHCFACGEIHLLQEVISYCFGHTDDIVGSFGWQWLLKNFATVQVEERKDVYLDFERYNRFDMFNNSRNRVCIRNNLNYMGTNRAMVSEEELDKYRYIHPYILKRGVSEKIVELFDIGWDSKTDCITFPNLDKYGNCLFVAKRSVKQKFFQYPKDVQKELYGIYQLYQLDPFPSEVYVCESMIDCLYLWTFDIPACAMNGLGNEIQFKQLRELPCRQLILATDADEAGQAARKRIRMNMQNMKIIKEVVLPKGRKDINDCSAVEIQNLVTVF
jgi:hypothetical protein